VSPGGDRSRDFWKSLLLISGFAALIVGAFILPQGRTRLLRDPCAQALMHLLAIEPGMVRSVLESHAHLCFRRPDGVEVFAYPGSEMVRIDVRLDGPQPTARVTSVGSPYFAPFPLPDHLLADHSHDAVLHP
jgi:hypothetical protein